MRWSPSDLERLKAAYSVDRPVDLDVLEAQFGRLKSNICRKAKALGLTNQKRAKVEQRKLRLPMFTNDTDRRAYQSAIAKARIARQGHPRGALGMKHTEETKRRMSAASVASWADPNSGLNRPAQTALRAAAMRKRNAAGLMPHGGPKGGRRSDLGDTYFRSRWEANYARYLNLLLGKKEILGWAYEPRRFVFEKVKRGTTSYTPDFRVDYPCGRKHEWHEVKGWVNQRSRTRLDRMGRYYPDEIVVVIGAAWFRQAVRSGFARTFPEWEYGRSTQRSAT